MRFSSSPSARKKTTTLAIEHLERREMMSGDSVYDPIAHVAPMIPGDTEEVLRQRIGDIGDRVHALTQMTDWRERDDVIDDVATSLATLNEDLSAPSTIQSDALTALRATLHDEIFKEFDIAKTMTPDDVVLDHGKKNDIEFSGVQAGRYENGATITVNRETLRLESQSGGNVIVSQGKLQGENQGGVTMTFVDEHGAPVMRGVRFVRVDPIPYAELGGTVIFHTPSGDVRFAAQYQQYSLDNNFLASSIRLEPDGEKSAGISTVMFIDPTPPVLLPDVPDTQPNDVPPVWEHWTTHALPTMETQAGLEAKNNANNALSAFLGAIIDEDAITKQIDNLTKDRDGVRTTITDLETQRETYRHDSQLLADKTTVYEKRKNELLTARQASNDALTAWKADRTNTTLWNAYQSANANFVTIKNAYAKDRPTFVGEMEAARQAGTKANYYLPKIEEKLRAAKQQEIDLTSTIDGLATDLETARNRTTNASGILNEATVEAAENDDTMLARSVPDFTSMECVMNADNTCASATVSLGALGGTLTIAGWQGALHTSPTMEGLADNSPSPVNAVSAKANGVSIDLSGSEHRVTRIVFTPESSGTEPLTVVVYRGETELCSMAAMPGEQCIIEETEGITGIVILPQMHALSPIAAELRGTLNQVQYMDSLTRRMIEHHVTWEQYKPYIPGREIETAMFFFDRYPQMIFEEQLAVIAEMRSGKQTDTVFLHDLAVDALMNKKQIDAKPMSPMATHALGMMGYDWNEHDNPGEIANRIGRGGGFVGVRLNDNMMEGNYRGFTYNMSGSSAPMPTALYWIDGDAHMRELPSWAYIIRGRTIVLLPNTPRCIFTNLDQPFTYSMTGNPAFSETSESLVPPVEMTLDYFFVHKKNGPSGQEGFSSPYINVADTVDFKFGTAEFWGNIVNKGTTGGPFTVDIYTGMTGTTQDAHVHTFTGTIAGQQTIGFKFFSDTTITGYVTVAMTTPDGRTSMTNIGISKPHFRSEDPDSPAVIASQQLPKDEATLLYESLTRLYGSIHVEAGTLFTEGGQELMPIGTASTALVQLVQGTSYVNGNPDTGLATTILALHDAALDDVHVAGEVIWNRNNTTEFNWTENPYDGDVYAFLEQQKNFIPFKYGPGIDYGETLQTDAMNMASRLASQLSDPVSGYISSWKRALFDGYDLGHPDEVMTSMLQDALYGGSSAVLLSSFSTLGNVVHDIEEQAKRDVQTTMDNLLKDPATYSTGFSLAKAEYADLVFMKAFLILADGFTPDNTFWGFLEWAGGEGMQFLGKFMRPGMKYALEGLDHFIPGAKSAGTKVEDFVKGVDDFMTNFGKGVTKESAREMDAAINQGMRLTGRAEPLNLNEKLAYQEVLSDPQKGHVIDITMQDPRWPATEGWVKMQQKMNGINIHYNYNTITGLIEDIKFLNTSL